MMDMEMNADLGDKFKTRPTFLSETMVERDGGEEGTQSPTKQDDVESESSQSSSEGSSASSTFCSLEKDYARVVQEMKNNEALAVFEPEYTSLFENLYRAHKVEKELSERIQSLTEELDESTEKLYELRKVTAADASEITKLKQQVDDSMKLADAAHTRELNAQEMIENLRVNIKKLTLEIEQKNKQLAAAEEDTGGIGKQKDGLQKEKDRLLEEIEIVKDQLKNTASYTEELEKKIEQIDREKRKMQETIEMQENQILKGGKFRESIEIELQQLREQLIARNNDLEMANSSLKVAVENVARLENLQKNSKSSEEKTRWDISKLTSKVVNLESDVENANAQIEDLEKQISEKDNDMKVIRLEVCRMEDEYAKLMNEKKFAEKKVLKCEAERSKLEMEVKRSERIAKGTTAEIQALRKAQRDEQQQIEALIREKNVLARTKENLQEHIKKLNHEFGVLGMAKRKINDELDNMTQALNETKRKLHSVEKERDKYIVEVQEFAQQVEDRTGDIQLKQLEIVDYKKRLAEVEAKYRQQQNLLEGIRAERNTCAKALTEAQEEIQELKSKVKITGHQVEQLKEDVATKEADIVKQEFLLGRVEKEKEALKAELQSRSKDIADLRVEVEKAKQEQKHLRQTLRKSETEIRRQKKNIADALNERDMLGTQLVRRNDELGLQSNRIQVLEGILKQGEKHYNERLEDIRLLKLEVKKLRTEKFLLNKTITNTSNLRQEVFHLAKDLARERLKVTALEEEVQTPINIHRWRKLQGTDPDTYNSLRKIQILQKRILKMSADSVDKEKKIRDTEKLYVNLRSILSKHPGPQAALSLRKAQNALRERGKKMKCLISEINMYEVQLSEYKFDVERMNKELGELKTKYYAQKKKLENYAEQMKAKSASEINLPAISSSNKKFRGGGFAMSAPALRVK